MYFKDILKIFLPGNNLKFPEKKSRTVQSILYILYPTWLIFNMLLHVFIHTYLKLTTLMN